MYFLAICVDSTKEAWYCLEDWEAVECIKKMSPCQSPLCFTCVLCFIICIVIIWSDFKTTHPIICAISFTCSAGQPEGQSAQHSQVQGGWTVMRSPGKDQSTSCLELGDYLESDSWSALVFFLGTPVCGWWLHDCSLHYFPSLRSQA